MTIQFAALSRLHPTTTCDLSARRHRLPQARAAASFLQRVLKDGSKVDDVDAARGLLQLETLVLARAQVTNIDALKGRTGLQQLNLADTRLGNIDALKDLKGLRMLNLCTRVLTE
ncbi:hypothetical protein LJR267_009175 [Paraburkholderia hospita]|uniref:hypothetical protein n=1 Tax=Paraburkholderia hospita TaxID=169430 RepID=UPI003ECCC746